MNRLLIVLALAGLLIACTTPESGESDPPEGSAAGSDAGAGAPSTSPSAACAEAFAPLAEAEIEALSDLGDLAAEVQPTIEACESVADWIAGAQPLFEEEINPNTVALLLSIQCQDLSLSRTPICEELASS